MSNDTVRVTELDLGGPCTCTFMDERCRYKGPETWCNRSAIRCEALGNLANYRGWNMLTPRTFTCRYCKKTVLFTPEAMRPHNHNPRPGATMPQCMERESKDHG